MKRLICLMAVLILPLWSLQPIYATIPSDTIKIISITGAKPIHRGVENEFTVEVAYSLESADEGIIRLGFNIQDPNSFVMLESKIVKAGSGTATLTGKVIPVDWEDRGRFSALVNISKYPHEDKWQALATDQQTIEVRK